LDEQFEVLSGLSILVNQELKVGQVDYVMILRMISTADLYGYAYLESDILLYI
jgi:hypothetical protein